MTTHEIVAALDEEIGVLERAKALLTEAEPVARRRGRPKGSTNKQTSFNPSEFAGKPRRKLSRAARERISAAQWLRWAKLKGTAAEKKTSAKKLTAKKGAETAGAGKRPMPVPVKRAARPKPAKAASKRVATRSQTMPEAAAPATA